MEFRTIVPLPSQRLKLTPASHVLLIGSCFTDHIGRHMTDALPAGHTLVNPNGVLYNPGSIYLALRQLIDFPLVNDDEGYFQGADGLWRHWHYAGEFAANTLDECRAKIDNSRQQAAEHLRKTDILFLTLSTDKGYFLSPDCDPQSLVANCHKAPARLFTEAQIPFSQIVDEGNALLQQLRALRPEMQVVFTLSPYRYRKYGLHESQVSKARLMHAIDLLCHANPNAAYFPAYEIILDELRDYRFYNADMLHPSEQAVDYVWERFQEWAFTPELHTYAQDKAGLLRLFEHRPLHPESEATQQFFRQREEKLAVFQAKWKENPLEIR